MTINDVIFKFYKPDELRTINKSQYSHFGWEGKDSFSFFTMAAAYKNGADAIFEKFTKSRGDNAILDTLVYPLCFLYRHCMELLIKYIYVKYQEYTEEELIKFMNTNHEIETMWKEVKPILSERKKKVGTKVDIGAIEHYIHEMAKFDKTSMRMRYPINKKLAPQNHVLWLDINNLHTRMDDFYSAINQIDYDIDNIVKNQASEEYIIQFTKMYELTKDKVLESIKTITQFAKNEKSKIKSLSIDSLFDRNSETMAKHRYLNSLSSDEKILIETLYYAGQSVRVEQIHLSSNKKDKRNDFITICIDHMKLNNLTFGKKVIDEDINIYSKSASAIVKELQTAIDILG